MGQKKSIFWSKNFFFKNGFLSLFLIKIKRIYSNKEKLCQKIQNTSGNFEKMSYFLRFPAKKAKTLQIQSKTAIKIHF
jgi:hypothetical protein